LGGKAIPNENKSDPFAITNRGGILSRRRAWSEFLYATAEECVD